MLTSQVFKSRFGQHYTLRLANQGVSSLPNRIKSERFIDKNTAWQFVSNLQVPLFFWENLAHANSFFNYASWKNANPGSSIEHYIAQALIQGSVRVYETPSLESLAETASDRRFTQDGIDYKISHVTSALCEPSEQALSFTDYREANKFLGSLELDHAQLSTLAQTLQLPIANVQGASSQQIKLDLSHALANGDVVIAPEPKKKPVAQDVIEEVIAVVTHNSGSESPPPAETTEEVESEEDPVCDFTNLRLHCQHKVGGTRKFELDVINKEPNHNGSQYGLQVISPPGTPDYISVLFNGVCRQGSDTCGSIKIKGPNTSQIKAGNRYNFKVAPKKLGNDSGSNSFINFLTNDLIPSVSDGLQYETYTVESQSCTGTKSHKAIVQAFPTFGWGGEISIGYTKDNENSSESKWVTKGKIGGNIGERTISFDTESKKGAEQFFPGLQNTLGDTLSQLSKFSSSAGGSIGSLAKFSIDSSIALGGKLDLKESVKNYDVGLGGELSISLNPLFGATVSVDIFDWLALSAGGPILLEYKKMAEKGEDHAVKIQAIVSVKGTVTANLKWEKGVDDKWLSTKGDKSSQAALGVTIGLDAEISVKTKIFWTSICVSAGAKAALQGARSNTEGIGIITTLTATTAEDKPAVSGSIAFTGATLYYSYYAEVGMSEASSESETDTPPSRDEEEDGASTPTDTQESKLTAGKESKIPIFAYREWPNNNASSEPITVDTVTF